MAVLMEDMPDVVHRKDGLVTDLGDVTTKKFTIGRVNRVGTKRTGEGRSVCSKESRATAELDTQ